MTITLARWNYTSMFFTIKTTFTSTCFHS